MVATNKLPRERIESLKFQSAKYGFPFVANDNELGILEFEDTGMDYLDFQQDYVVAGTVKLSLVAPDPEVAVLLNAPAIEGPRVAGLEEIFRLKCIACANRSKSRDWLDMYTLLTQGRFQPEDIYKSFELAGVPQKLDIAMRRMTRGKLDLSDEGYETLLPNPPSIETMQIYFVQVFNDLQIQVAKSKMQKSGSRLRKP